jgi:hypothetical protein
LAGKIQPQRAASSPRVPGGVLNLEIYPGFSIHYFAFH